MAVNVTTRLWRHPVTFSIYALCNFVSLPFQLSSAYSACILRYIGLHKIIQICVFDYFRGASTTVPPYRIIRIVSLIHIVNAQLQARVKGMHDVDRLTIFSTFPEYLPIFSSTSPS